MIYNKALVEELIEVSKGIILKPYYKGRDQFRLIYFIKRVQVKGNEGFCLAYNRHYSCIGSIPFGEFERLLKESKIIQVWFDYLGGENEPDIESDGVELATSGHICGDAFWFVPKENKA